MSKDAPRLVRGSAGLFCDGRTLAPWGDLGWISADTVGQVLARPRAVLQIARLRRNGLVIAWDVELGGTAEHLHHGRNCVVGAGSMVWIDEAGPLILGDHVVLGSYSNVRAATGTIRIGSRVLFAQFVSLISANHRIGDDGVPSWHEIDIERRGITIGDDCWIGAQAVILPGVDLGARCVVGAGSVVTRSFPAGSRLVGVPARPL